MIRFACRLVLAGCCCLVALPTWHGADDGPPPKGSLVIIGGNLRPGNAPVWERIIAAGRRQGCAHRRVPVGRGAIPKKPARTWCAA